MIILKSFDSVLLLERNRIPYMDSHISKFLNNHKGLQRLSVSNALTFDILLVSVSIGKAVPHSAVGSASESRARGPMFDTRSGHISYRCFSFH